MCQETGRIGSGMKRKDLIKIIEDIDTLYV